MQLGIGQFKKQIFKHFPVFSEELEVQKLLGDQKVGDEFATYLETLRIDFQERFADFRKLEPLALFISQPFCDIDIENISDKICDFLSCESTHIEDEVIRLRNDISLKANFGCDLPSFWKLASPPIYPHILELVSRIFSCFGSTYFCEMGFSTMNNIKNKHRNRLSDCHLADCLRLAVSSSYVPDYDHLAKNMQSQVSH